MHTVKDFERSDAMKTSQLAIDVYRLAVPVMVRLAEILLIRRNDDFCPLARCLR